ncbi:MAG: hypothetical protein ACXAAH_03785, partial [Promethearchaeota archaeon]
RALQNLWGINKDYEEVILCVLSKIEFRGDTITEIAGIGSIIEEHIKIFVPILEDAWVSSRKEIMRTIKSTLSKEPVQTPEPVREKEKPLTIPPEVETPEKIIPETTFSSPLSSKFDNILNSVDTKSCLEISSSLERFQSEFVKLKGYNSVLKNIHTTCNDLKGKSEKLNQLEKEKLKGQMKIWRQQLNL